MSPVNAQIAGDGGAEAARSKGARTRSRILDIAEAAILAKGLEATSIEEIVAGAAITRSGFFYHFRDKNALARALVERYLEQDREILGGLFARGRELSDDPLHAFLIGLRLFAEMTADLPNGHPGCLVATVCYQERLFDAEVRGLVRSGVLEWRELFLDMLREIAERHPPRDGVDLSKVADMATAAVEGGIILAKATGEPAALPGQILLYRSYVKLLFDPAA